MAQAPARPMPDPAPVTNATRSRSDVILAGLLICIVWVISYPCACDQLEALTIKGPTKPRPEADSEHESYFLPYFDLCDSMFSKEKFLGDTR